MVDETTKGSPDDLKPPTWPSLSCWPGVMLGVTRSVLCDLWGVLYVWGEVGVLRGLVSSRLSVPVLDFVLA